MGAPYRHMELHQQAMAQQGYANAEFELGKRQYEAMRRPCDYCKQPSTGAQCCKQCGAPRNTNPRLGA